ncbi:MAG: serine/threonine protein kinase [Proteobacteria bacterium]|nr:serine/threonine protein kinase [Pseudomonadota bacterium]
MNDSEQHKSSAGEGGLRFPLPTGTRVDHYVIREVLGAGGFGITYLAEHEALGKEYAIKEYFPHAFSVRQGTSVRPTSAGDGTYKWGLDRFVTEARALARFKHPAIVDVTSIFEANGTAYIVLGYEQGTDMSQWLKRLGRPPSQDELDRLLTPLLGALEEIHKHNMMHRDISPDNLLIRDDGRPVLIDFGSARESIRGRARALSAIVKHGYSPPEQYSSRPELQGPWTDIYALSATIYRAVSTKLPPDATERLIRDDLQPLARLARAPYRPSFLEAIDRGLKIKPEERPQSIIEWREMLFRPEPLRQPVRIPAERPSQPESTPSARQRSPQSSNPRAGLVSNRPSLEPAANGSRRADGGTAGALQAANRSSRISGSPSMRKSERPDLGWLDEADAPEVDEPKAAPGANTSQIVTYVILGLLAGAAAGALVSIILASIISTSCFADSCLFRYLAICASLGALIGGGLGAKLALSSDSGTEPTPPPAG